MDAGPGHSCKHDIQIAQLVISQSNGIYALQHSAILFCFTIS